MSDTPPTPERLVAQLGWIRALARELVSDVHLADDLAQEACLTALKRGPEDPAKMRGWLRSVLVNRVRQMLRGDGRRAGREVSAARPESLESTASVVERASVHRELAQVVLALDEPYRTVILSRYFDGLAPRVIAKRTGVGVGTIQSQLKRGLVRLREQLDREHGGDRRAWLAFLVPVAQGPAPLGTPGGPLAGSSAPLSAASLGAIIVNTKLIIASVAAVVAIGTIAYVAGDRDDTEAPARGVASEPVARPAYSSPSLPIAPGTSRAGGRELQPAGADVPEPGGAASESAAADTESLVEATPWTLSGRVLDTEANPLGGVELVIEGKDESFASSSGGAFETETVVHRGHVVPAPSSAADWVAVHQASFRRDSVLEPVLVIARALRFGGSVVNTFGAPVADAHLELIMPRTLDVVLGRVMDATRRLRFVGTSDAHGNFAVARVPRVAGAEWHITAEGYQRAVLPAPADTEAGRTIVLEQPSVPLEGLLAGRVLDQRGNPLADARVAVGVTSVKTDHTGAFQLDLSRALTADRITAVKTGYLPAFRMREEGSEFDGAPAADPLSGWPAFVELTLTGPPLTIKGRVVGPDGSPVVGAKVWTPDGTRFGMVGMMPATIENLMAGAPIPAEALSAPMPEEDSPGSVYGMHRDAGEALACWNWVLSDASGNFELPGLLDQAYRLRAMDATSLLDETTDPVAAGSRGVRIELRGEAVHAQVRGRVVTDRGAPLEGISVLLHREAFRVRSRFFGGTAEVGIEENRETVRTDADGCFELLNVPKRDMRLHLRSDSILPTAFNLPEKMIRTSATDSAPRRIDIMVDARCHLRVELGSNADGADQVEVIDEAGNNLPLLQISEGSVSASSRFALVNGQTGVLSVSSRARSLRVLRGGDLLFELDLDLLPGEVTVIR